MTKTTREITTFIRRAGTSRSPGYRRAWRVVGMFYSKDMMRWWRGKGRGEREAVTS